MLVVVLLLTELSTCTFGYAWRTHSLSYISACIILVVFSLDCKTLATDETAAGNCTIVVQILAALQQIT